MTAASHITDPLLQRVLAATTDARNHCFALDQDTTSFDANQLSARLAILRGLDRKAIFSVRETKQRTAEARSEVDELHLGLQNLYYEQRHLMGEIRGCEEFDHKYTKLPMIPVEEFLAAHPELADADAHDLTLARIQDEHEARKELEEKRLELVKRKDELVRETSAKKEELAKLDAELEKWMAGQESIRKIFDSRTQKEEDVAG